MTNQIMIYNGPLEELNSRNPEEQYKFAKSTIFFSKPYNAMYISDRLNSELSKEGLDGIVNAQFSYYFSKPGAASTTKVRVSGTPILKV
tara:strand:- start:163 stop:429 length:267 start_codon:yes stop_codon:yes gene_type:complete